MQPRFTAHRTGLVRASTLRSARDLPRWPEAPADSPDHRSEWIAWLRQVRDHPVVGPAIREASPALVQRLDQICGEGGHGRDIARVSRSCARYVLRSQSRATPFGLFAGVAPMAFTSTVSGGIGDDHRPVARVNATWIDAAVSRLESCAAEFTSRLTVVVNDLAVVRDGRVIVEHRPRSGADRGTCSSLRLTAPLRLVMGLASNPIPRSEVEAVLATAFPGREDAARTMVDTLVDHRVLLTCLRPPMYTPDPLEHLIGAMRDADADRYPQAATILARLDDAHQALCDHDDAPTTNGRAAAAGRAHEALAKVTPEAASAVVDLRLDSDLTLPRTVAWQMQGAAAVLARLAPEPRGTAVWRDYHRRFRERYGVGARVPVAELTDPDRGLGLPAGFYGSRLPSPPAEAVSDRDIALLDLAQRAASGGENEVVVDEAVLDRLGSLPEAVWPHTELRGRVHATSREALTNGEFRIVVAGVSRAAGTTVGRFLDLLPPADRDDLTNLYRRLPTLRRNAITAQLTCPTRSGRGDQISRTPRVLETTLALGQHHPSEPDALRLDELAVTADARHLHLISTRHDRPVEPVVFNAIEFTRAANPLLRFLAELSYARATVSLPFSWGAAGHLPFLPRVLWQQCVLAPARWRLDACDLPNPRASWREWTDHLNRWRTTHRVPPQVEFGDNDQRLHLDLHQPAHQDLVRTTLNRNSQVFLREAPTSQDLAWIGGRAHEIVTTLTAELPQIPVRSRPGSAHPRAAEHLPGGPGWCSVKLYGHPDRTTHLITDELPRLAGAGAPEAWFLRYHDPDPHLRLRIRIDGPDQLRVVHSWTRDLRERGMVAAVVHDTYTPEAGRFGPGAAMAAAEALFVADSRAVAAQLSTTPDETGTRVWAAVSMTDLAHHVLGDEPAARTWLIAHAPPGTTDRAEAVRTITLTNPNLEGHPTLIQDVWRQRTEAVHAYAKALIDLGLTAEDVLPDLLHLHSTRLFGPDPDAERSCLALARAAALSWNARIKETAP
ncbi:lantibiotic dehydratase [Nocardiopsis sp. EMB25]|uniref:lantibiotic dehydratase n=1 Tax=Nocardiopsis sp. EMB25 TaxID=2835867 RepID=UPI0022842EC8|nr:lantibiotic dehydratase [Nocardiopsis sp. EMB25]MCY9785199.1 lantibiotic dehydratase [Nocardiopsis sp. EMB25]